MVVTLREVAERAGVSRSAVSRTYTDGASVSEKTRKKVEQAASDLGYSPNVLASSLTTGRTKLIGLVSDNFKNPIFLEIFDRCTKGLQERGLRPLLVNLSNETEPGNAVRMLRQYSVDAVIVASSTLPSSFALEFHEAGMPVVHSFGRLVRKPAVHVVGIDNRAAGRLAARTLVERGYSNVAMMAGPATATSTQDRLAGFLKEIEAHPHMTVSHSFSEAYSFDAGRAQMARLLRQDQAEAYFCGDDVLSIGALSAAQSAGLRVPEDIGFIGVNDMEMSRWQNIDLTTIRNPLARIVETSLDLVDRMLETPDLPAQAHKIKAELVERGTLRPPEPR